MTRNYGEMALVLNDLVIAPYTQSSDLIGTAVALPDPMKLTMTPVADNPELKSKGRLAHAATVVTHYTITISSGGIPWNALVILAGWTLSSPSAGVERLRGTPGQPLPYFAAAGKMLDAYTGDVHVGLVACVLDIPPEWTANENNEFFVSEMSGKVINVASRNLPYIEKHQTAAAIDLATLFS